jgi:hypothetical protein
MVSKLQELGESALSSGKASLSVVLVLLAGYLLRKTDRVSKEGESNISKLGEGPNQLDSGLNFAEWEADVDSGLGRIVYRSQERPSSCPPSSSARSVP